MSRNTNYKELNLLLAANQLPGLVPVLKEKDEKKDAEETDATPMVYFKLGGDEEVESTPRTIVPQVMASLSVSLASMIVGFASAYTSPALVSMTKENSTRYMAITPQEASWICGIMPLAALVGGVIGGTLIEKAGRKATILGTAMPFVLSWLLIAFAHNVPMILSGRAIAGFCVGIASLSLPVYLGETVQPQVRGRLGLLPTAIGNIGILMCFVAGKYMDWTMLAIFGACLPLPFLICMCLIPETPRWYISKNKHKQGRKALQWLRGKDTDISGEFTEIEKAHILSQKYATKLSDLFCAANMKSLFISLGLMFFQQMSGINAVIFYTVMIFEYAGSPLDENLCTIIVGIVNFVATFIATIFIDRLGRKVLLYISDIFMVITLTTLGTYFYLKDTGTDVSEYGWLPLVSFMLFVLAFSLGFGPIPWLMMGEIFPARIRGAAAAFATSFNWACTFGVTKTFMDLIELLGTHGAFWLFAIILVVGLFFVIFCVPETQGKSLEDIEKNLKGPVRRVSSIANLKPMPMGF